MPNLARIRAIAIALKHRAFKPSPEAVQFAAAKARRIAKYGPAEQMAFHATSLLKKHARILSKRSKKNIGAGLQRQAQYVRHVQKSMKKILKGKSSGYGSALMQSVKVRRA